MDRLKLGVILGVIGAVASLLAVWVVWCGTARWLASSYLSEVVTRRFSLEVSAARAAANEARGWDASLPAAALGSLDPTQARSIQEAKDLAITMGTQHAGLARLTADFCRVVQGGRVEDDHPSFPADVALLRHLVELRGSGKLAGLPQDSGSPQMAIMLRTLEERMTAAWRSGDGTAWRDSASALFTLSPRHPVAKPCEAVLELLAPNLDATRANALLNQVEVRVRAPMLRSLAALVAREPTMLGPAAKQAPQRISEIIRRIPAEARTEAERVAELCGTGSLDAAADTVVRNKDGPMARSIAQRAVLAGQWGAVGKLVAANLLDDEFRLRLAIATADVATLKQMAVKNPVANSYLPTVSQVRRSNEEFSFHCANAIGLPVANTISLTMNGRPVSTDRITRLGTMVTVAIPAETLSFDLRVLVGNAALYEGKVQQ